MRCFSWYLQDSEESDEEMARGRPPLVPNRKRSYELDDLAHRDPEVREMMKNRAFAKDTTPFSQRGPPSIGPAESVLSSVNDSSLSEAEDEEAEEEEEETSKMSIEPDEEEASEEVEAEDEPEEYQPVPKKRGRRSAASELATVPKSAQSQTKEKAPTRTATAANPDKPKRTYKKRKVGHGLSLLLEKENLMTYRNDQWEVASARTRYAEE